MILIDPNSYSLNNCLQTDDANYVLDNYLDFIDLNPYGTILDVGVGEGTVLANHLIPRLPTTYKKVVALDINENMLRHCKEACKNNPRVEYECCDVGTKTLPLRLERRFDHIFAFDSLNWVMDQRQGVENLFKMLKGDGTILLGIIASHSLFEVYEKLAKKDRWAPYMQGFRECISPYFYDSNPALTMENHLNSVGFVGVKCEVVDRLQVFGDISHYYRWASALNPIFSRLPREELPLYEEDYKTESLASLRARNKNNNENTNEIYDSYQMLIVLASKPNIAKRV